MNTYFYKTLRRIRFFLIRHSSNKRPTSTPYISGDTFRSFAKHLYDETKKVRGVDIKEGSIVFVKSNYMGSFFRNVHPHIAAPYTLVTHNSDYNITNKDLALIDDKIIHWFGQNVCVEDGLLHPKLIPLPIGLENVHLSHHGRISRFDSMHTQIASGNIVKKPRILTSFSVTSNVNERTPALAYLKSHPLSYTLSTYISSGAHMKLLAESMFVASPPGNGIDCIRTWEALYLRTIPIVKRSTATEYFKGLGLPLYLIDDWNELDMVDESSLVRIYEEMKHGFANEELWSDYLQTMIQK